VLFTIEQIVNGWRNGFPEPGGERHEMHFE